MTKVKCLANFKTIILDPRMLSQFYQTKRLKNRKL